MSIKKTIIASAILGVLSFQPVSASTESDDLRKLIEKQQQQLEKLKKRLDEQAQKIEVTAEEVEKTQSNNQADTTIGGYGELHYTNQGNQDTLDFHRFVLFFGHKFNDKLRFSSELEVEHAVVEGGAGAVEIEQAFLEYDVNQNLSAKAGIFLTPVGILNETHEPTTFYGVERNPVEKNIIPTTWSEGGVGLNYRPLPGLSIDANITGGLNVPTSGGSAYKIRNGRTGVAEAKAESFAFTSRVKYTGVRGLELSASFQYQDDITQGDEGADATLLSAHGIYQNGDFSFRALYAIWDLNSDKAALIGRDKQSGFYLEPSYKLTDKLGIFARYNEWNNQAGLSSTVESKQTSVGINYWLAENVVLKMDWDKFSGALDGDGFNLGMGYQF